jgi:ATP-dependent Clp protease ATP-binding subunit ClpC
MSTEEYDDEMNSSNKKLALTNKKNSKTPVLDSFSKDLTKLAEEGKIEPIIGREKEILRVSQILSRKKKSNPILIGEPGCVDGDTLITVRKISDEGSHKIIYS